MGNKSRGNADSSRYPALPTIREGLCRSTTQHIPTAYQAPLQRTPLDRYQLTGLIGVSWRAT